MPINPAFRRTDLKTERIASEIETILARYSRAGTRKGNAGNYRVPRCAVEHPPALEVILFLSACGESR
jgi:hypothetical protein